MYLPRVRCRCSQVATRAWPGTEGEQGWQRDGRGRAMPVPGVPARLPQLGGAAKHAGSNARPALPTGAPTPCSSHLDVWIALALRPLAHLRRQRCQRVRLLLALGWRLLVAATRARRLAVLAPGSGSLLLVRRHRAGARPGDALLLRRRSSVDVCHRRHRRARQVRQVVAARRGLVLPHQRDLTLSVCRRRGCGGGLRVERRQVGARCASPMRLCSGTNAPSCMSSSSEPLP